MAKHDKKHDKSRPDAPKHEGIHADAYKGNWCYHVPCDECINHRPCAAVGGTSVPYAAIAHSDSGKNLKTVSPTYSSKPVTPRQEPNPTHLLVAIINGDVQMRSCRNSIRTLAEPLGILGRAVNRPGGEVEVWAWAAPDTLATFRSGLTHVPSGNTNFVQCLPVIEAPATMGVPSGFDYW